MSKTTSPQAVLTQGVVDTAHSQGLRPPKLVSAARCLGRGLWSRTCHKPKLRISPEQQQRGWGSSHPDCLFHGEVPVSPKLSPFPAHTRPGLLCSCNRKHQSPRFEALFWTLGPTGSLLLVQTAGCSGDPKTSCLGELLPDKHVSCRLWFIFSGHPLTVTL